MIQCRQCKYYVGNGNGNGKVNGNGDDDGGLCGICHAPLPMCAKTRMPMLAWSQWDASECATFRDNSELIDCLPQTVETVEPTEPQPPTNFQYWLVSNGYGFWDQHSSGSHGYHDHENHHHYCSYHKEMPCIQRFDNGRWRIVSEMFQPMYYSPKQAYEAWRSSTVRK